jgi:hypothetical protein
MSKQKSSDSQTNQLPWEAAFAKSLARARLDASMSQTELARRATEAGLPLYQQQIQRIENLTRPVRLNEAVLLARVLHGDPWDMAAQMVDDETAWTILQASQDGAEEAAFRTIRTLRDEYYRFNSAVHEEKDRLEQYAAYRQERGVEKFNPADVELLEHRHERLLATMQVLAEALNILLDDHDEPRFASLPTTAPDV